MNRHTPMLPEHDVRETPPELFARLHARHRFTLDGAANHANALCDRYCTEQGTWAKLSVPNKVSDLHGLSPGAWKGYRVFCNPPYTMIPKFVEQAWSEQAELVVMLVPATRTEQPWWQEMIEPYRDAALEDFVGPGNWSMLRVAFLSGRTHFLENGGPIYRRNKDGTFYADKKTGEKVRSAPKFGCCTLTWMR